MDKKKILLTGASGFLGTAVASLLLREGYNLKCVIRKSSKLNKHFKCEYVYADLLEKLPDDLFDDIDIVIHIAGLTKTKNWRNFYKVNFEGTKNMVSALSTSSRRDKIEQFVYISSLAASGPRKNKNESSLPISHYGKSKIMAENEVKKLSIPTTIIRPPAIYGPYDIDFFEIFKLIKKGYVFMPKADNYLSIIHIDDAARAILFATRHPKNITYEIDDGKLYRTYDIMRGMIKFTNPNAKLIRIPLGIIKIIRLISYTGIFGILLNPDKLTESMYSWIADSSNIVIDGFKPLISLDYGIESTVKWYYEHGWWS